MTTPAKEAAVFIRHYLECDCDGCITEIETAVETAIDAATAELRAENEKLKEQVEQWKNSCRELMRQREH